MTVNSGEKGAVLRATSGTRVPATLLVWLLAAGAAWAADAPAPLVPPYVADRSLSATDFVRFDWKDAKRDRVVPVKLYFPTEGTAPFPVVLFSHGLGGSRENYEYLGRQWAANGYVVVHLQHLGSDDAVWRGQPNPGAALRKAANAENSIARVKDVQFALGELESLNHRGTSEGGDDRLKGKLDLSHVGISGHSFGAQTSLLIVGQQLGGPLVRRRVGELADDRVRCAVPMSAPRPATLDRLDEVYAAIRVPVLLMTGTEDDSPIGETKAADRTLPFVHMKQSPRFSIVFEGGDHMVFSGRRRNPRTHDDEHQKMIRLSSTAFFDAYLRDDASARDWLTQGGFANELGRGGSFDQK